MIDKVKLGDRGGARGRAGIWAYYWLGESTALVLRLLAVVAGMPPARRWRGSASRASSSRCSRASRSAEVKKVVWPTRKETMQTTAAVFAFVVVMAVFLWVSDKTLEWVLYDLILGWKKT